MNANDPNVQLVELVSRALGRLNERLVFVGGCATGLLITDDARPPVRATRDVDLVAEIASQVEYHKISAELRNLGFKEDQGEIICRWHFQGLIVDIMPTDEAVLGFSNRWYPDVARDSASYHLPSGRQIRLISPPLLIATKLEAFYGRGNHDYGRSHDIEDIVNVVDGRLELVDEVLGTKRELRDYLTEEVDSLLAEPAFVNTLSWHFAPDTAAQGRVPLVVERLRRIAGL